MPEVAVASRQLKNVHTGIDIHVPQYKINSGLVSATVTYQMLIVTNLPYFKGKIHDKDQIVQYAISHRYSEFEMLHSTLESKFSSVVLPKLPSKTFVIGEAQVKERLAALDTLMKYIAQSGRLAQTTEVLTFLGVQKSKINEIAAKIDDNQHETVEVKEEKEAGKHDNHKKSNVTRNDIFDDVSDEQVDGIFISDEAPNLSDNLEVTGEASQAGKVKPVAGRVFHSDLGLDAEVEPVQATQDPVTSSELDDILGVGSELEDVLTLNIEADNNKPPAAVSKDTQTGSDVTADTEIVEHVSSSEPASTMNHDDITSYINTLHENDASANLFD